MIHEQFGGNAAKIGHYLGERKFVTVEY